jgi:hypothetical protein
MIDGDRESYGRNSVEELQTRLTAAMEQNRVLTHRANELREQNKGLRDILARLVNLTMNCVDERNYLRKRGL